MQNERRQIVDDKKPDIERTYSHQAIMNAQNGAIKEQRLDGT